MRDDRGSGSVRGDRGSGRVRGDRGAAVRHIAVDKSLAHQCDSAFSLESELFETRKKLK